MYFTTLLRLDLGLPCDMHGQAPSDCLSPCPLLVPGNTLKFQGVMQGLGTTKQPRQEQMSRKDGRLWHGTSNPKAWTIRDGNIWQPLVLDARVLERPVLEPFAEEMARSPVLQSAFEKLLRDPDAAEFRGTAGQSVAHRNKLRHTQTACLCPAQPELP